MMKKKSPSSAVCRCLFGPVDRVRNSKDLRLLRSILDERDRLSWNFDFRFNVPMVGRFDWTTAPFKDDEERGRTDQCGDHADLAERVGQPADLRGPHRFTYLGPTSLRQRRRVGGSILSALSSVESSDNQDGQSNREERNQMTIERETSSDEDRSIVRMSSSIAATAAAADNEGEGEDTSMSRSVFQTVQPIRGRQETRKRQTMTTTPTANEMTGYFQVVKKFCQRETSREDKLMT